MQTIKYIFADGTTSEIEVTDEFYTLYAELGQQEKRNHWKETRRHTSLEYLNENGIDFESLAADPLSVLLRSEDEERIHKTNRKVKSEKLPEKGKIVSCGCRVYERFSDLSAFVKGADGNGKRALECVAVL